MFPSNWQEVTDRDELTKIRQKLAANPLQFPSSEIIQGYSEIADRFIDLILVDCVCVFMTDESSLFDFEFIYEVANLEEKIKEVFGVDVSDLEDKKMVDIFERIERNTQLDNALDRVGSFN
jgi:hypothetical protein